VKVYNNIDKEKEKVSSQKVMDLLKQSDEKSTGLVNLEEQKMEDTMKYGNKVGSNWLEDEQVETPSEELQIGNTLNCPHVERSRRPPSKKKG
jgi:serine/threonine protein phosphatase PrpC